MDGNGCTTVYPTRMSSTTKTDAAMMVFLSVRLDVILTNDMDDRDATSCSALRTTAIPEATIVTFLFDDVRTMSKASRDAVTASPNMKDKRGTYHDDTVRFLSMTPTSGRPMNRTRTGRKTMLETASLANALAIMEMSETNSPAAYHLQRRPFIRHHFN